MDRIQQLESDLQDFQSFFDDRANELTDFLAATQRATFRGAVVAFNRSEKTDGDVCPPGWRPFEPAGGRFIVGAGLHRNQDANGTLLDSYPSYAGDPEAAVGGEASGRLVASDVFETDPKFIAKHSLTGANIPPYVALYYCWFDG